jgi:hypothetical protein
VAPTGEVGGPVTGVLHDLGAAVVLMRRALSKSRQWVLTALRSGGDLQTVKQLGDRLAQAGHPLKPRTIQTALGELEAAGLAAGSEEGNGRARYWSPATASPGSDDGEAGAGGGEGMP